LPLDHFYALLDSTTQSRVVETANQMACI